MSEKSFFEKTGPYKLKILSDHINGKLSSIENSDIQIDDISSFKNKDFIIDLSKACENENGKKDINKIDKLLNLFEKTWDLKKKFH